MRIETTEATVELDARVCNKLVLPKRGEQRGRGIHVPIPEDWEARILAGERVPGCTYVAPQREVDELDGKPKVYLEISNELETRLKDAAAKESLTAAEKLVCDELSLKVDAAKAPKGDGKTGK
jgi:hypothetical protein